VKTAKEWAESVVSRPETVKDGEFHFFIEDNSAMVLLDGYTSRDEAEHIAHEVAGIIEQLVERVQADACASLEAVLRDVGDELRHLSRHATEGSAAEYVCERLLPKIEDALR
jgi:hypothetical protein